MAKSRVYIIIISAIFLIAIVWAMTAAIGTNIFSVFARPHLQEAAIVPLLSVEPRRAVADVYDEIGVIAYGFQVKNTSDRAVTIDKIVPDCGCTNVKISRTSLAPHEEARLEVTYVVQGIVGELPDRKIVLTTLEQPLLPLICTIGGVRRSRYFIDPPVVNFGEIVEGVSPIQRVVITVQDPGVELALDHIQCSDPVVQVKVVKVLRDPGAFKVFLDVRIASLARQGAIDASVSVPSIGDKESGPRIDIRGKISGPVRLDPPHAFFGILNASETADRFVRVRAFPASPKKGTPPDVRITAFPQVPSGLRLVIDPRDPERICITADSSKLPPGDFRFDLKIECIVNEQPREVVLVVSGRVK